MGDGLRSARDRAVLALGMAAALRRSELVALTLEDIELVPEGLKILIRGSKTDQERVGATIAIPEGRRIRPEALLLAWMEAAGHQEGSLFRKLKLTTSIADCIRRKAPPIIRANVSNVRALKSLSATAQSGQPGLVKRRRSLERQFGCACREIVSLPTAKAGFQGTHRLNVSPCPSG